jgi:hypothetical protein
MNLFFKCSSFSLKLMLLHALRRYCILRNLSEHGLKILCLLHLTMLSKRMFLLGQKLYTTGAGDMEAFTFQDLCLVIFSSWLGADGMGHLSSALQHHKSSLSSPPLQLSLLGAQYGPFIYIPLHSPAALHSGGMAWPIHLVHYSTIGLIQSIFPPQQPSTLQNASPASSHTYKILATFIPHMTQNCFLLR